jgi:hypothetical protein
MQFIEFDDLGGGAPDPSDFLPESFDPLIDRHMTKPQNPTNGPKAQAFQVQGHCQAALGRGRGIGFMGNGKKILTRFAFVALAPFVGATFDFVGTGAPWTIQHRHLQAKG